MKRIKKYKEIILISLFISFSIFLCCLLRKESDYFWHIKAGEHIFNTGPLIKDIFSWSLNGKYWMSHEWLFELFMYVLKLIFGNFNLIVYIVLSLLTIYVVIFKYNKNKMFSNLFFTLIWYCFSCIFMPFIQGRPHFVSFVLFSFTMYFIFNLIDNEDSRKIYFLPLITILWSNFHGGSSNLGYLFCFFVFIVGLFNFKLGKIEAKGLSKKQLIKLFIIGIICIICTGINIHGFKMTIYPYTNLMDSTMINSIAEWAPTNINDLTHLPFFITAFVILMVLLISNKKIRFIDFALFGVGLFLGLKSIRFWPYLYLISSFFIFDYIQSFKFNNLPYIIVLLDFILIGIFIYNFKNINKEINKEYMYLDKEMINIIKLEKPKRLFNMYNTGGELIYNDILAFIDGRADLYSSNGVFNAYNAITNLEMDYKEQLSRYNFDYYLVDVGSRLDNYIKMQKGINKVYSNDNYVLYKKETN